MDALPGMSPQVYHAWNSQTLGHLSFLLLPRLLVVPRALVGGSNFILSISLIPSVRISNWYLTIRNTLILQNCRQLSKNCPLTCCRDIHKVSPYGTHFAAVGLFPLQGGRGHILLTQGVALGYVFVGLSDRLSLS